MITWEQAVISHSKTEKTPLPLYNGFVAGVDKPVVRIEQEYTTAQGFKNNWEITILGVTVINVAGTMNDAENIKLVALGGLKAILEKIKDGLK